MAQQEETIENKVAKSSLITLDLDSFYPEGERVLYDIKDNLYQGMILREKDFREFVKEHDWGQYEGKNIAITCSVDAIVPTWAYMLLVTKMEPYANMIVFGNLDTLEDSLFKEEIHRKINPPDYDGAKVVIKGCSEVEVPVGAFMEISRILRPYVKSMMYGEACSSVPIYKQPRNQNPKK